MDNTTTLKSKENAKRELARRGSLRYMLEEDQHQIYDFFLDIGNDKSRLGHISRRFGKTFVMLLIQYEVGMGNIKTTNRLGIPQFNLSNGFLGQTKKAMDKIMFPMMRTIEQHIPKNLRPKFKERADGWVFPRTNTVLSIAGTDNQGFERLRGTETHLFCGDEAAFYPKDHYDYIFNSIILPQTLRGKGKILYGSTTPKTADHPFNQTILRHKMQGRYLCLTIDDKVTLDQVDKDLLIEEMGGINSPDVRRELFMELVVDEDMLIFPVCSDEKIASMTIGMDDYEIPEYYDYYSALDPGARHSCGFLTGFYDYMRGKLVITDEYFKPHEDTEILVDEMRTRERRWYGHKEPLNRVCDNSDLILINDMNRLHGMSFSPARKDTLRAMVNQTTILLKNNFIEINKDCKNLLEQLQFGMWNNQKTKFAESAGRNKHHYDLLPALIYMNRIIDFSRNPFPAIHPSIPLQDYHVPNIEDKSDVSQIKQGFGFK